jgi:hypothetical protein
MPPGPTRRELENLLRKAQPVSVPTPDAIPHLDEIRAVFLETAIPDSAFEIKRPPPAQPKEKKPKDIMAELAALNRVPTDQTGPIRGTMPDAYVPHTYNEYDVFGARTEQDEDDSD